MATVRHAELSDVSVLVNHHVAMFREIYAVDGLPIDDAAFAEMGKAYCNKLSGQLTDGTCRAWVVEEGTVVVASAGITRIQVVPIPTDPNFEIGFLHSVYTEPVYRRQGYAKLLVAEAMRYCSERGINRIDLAASTAGRSMYEGFGFKASVTAMRYTSLLKPIDSTGNDLLA